jgi:two-component system, sensor histidine kinase PdtaS
VGDRIIIIILFGLLHSACTAQYYPAPPPIEARREPELLLQLKNTKADPDRIRSQLQLANLYFNEPFKKNANFEQTLHYAREAAALSTSLHDSAGYINAELYIGDVLAERFEFAEAKKILPLLNDSAKINLLLAISFKLVDQGTTTEHDDSEATRLAQEARNISIRLHQPVKELLALLNLATVHVDQEKPGAEKELLDLIDKSRAIGYRNLHYIYFKLAMLESELDKRDKTFAYSMQTINSMRTTGDSIAAGDFYYIHASICLKIEEFQEGINYARLSIEGYQRHTGEFMLPNAAELEVFGLRKMKRLPEALETMTHIVKQYPPEDLETEYKYNRAIGELYIDMKMYGKSEPYLLLALDNGIHLGANLAPLYRDLGRLYTEDHQYAKARPYLNKALAGTTSPSFLSYTHYLLFLVDSATGNYLGAIAHLHKNHGLTDSSLAQAKQRDIQRLLVQYETKEKENKLKIEDQDIALLNQKAVSQKAQLSRSNLLRNITIGSALISMLIAFLLYRSYRVKQRINRLILQKNETLEQLVTEKEWLLKEVHHRVKNNLHTVNCLLESQACYLEDDALKAIQKSQQRIYAMSMIHQKIYQSEDIRTINMANYLPEFITYLRDSFGAPANIRFELEIEDLDLEVAHAVPVALIVNEAVNNSIKYAFAENEGGHILIALRRVGRQVQLSVADDGIGIKSEFMDGDADSLGMQLMKGLSREMKGKFTIETGNGTRIVILFDPASIDELQPLYIPTRETTIIA